MKKTIFELHEEEKILEVYTDEDGKTTVQQVEHLEEIDLYDIENFIEDYMLEFGLEEKDIERKNL